LTLRVSTDRGHQDAGLRSAVNWLDRRWRRGAELDKIDEELRSPEPVDGRRWYTNRNGDTMAVIYPRDFLMGSPEYEPKRAATETEHFERIPRNFAMATKEVTVNQFREFLKANPTISDDALGFCGGDGNGPIMGVTWFEAAQYCRWLSEKEEIPANQMCYPASEQIQKGMR